LWAPGAKRDIRILWRYLERVASAGVADALYLEIERVTALLRERPHVGRPRDDIYAGVRSILVHPYAIYYRVHDDKIEIVRILHQRRDVRKALREK
jgi:toxin ParE1/3/4